MNFLDALQQRQLILRPSSGMPIKQAPVPVNELASLQRIQNLEKMQIERVRINGDASPAAYPEMVRILSLPASPPISTEEHEEFCRRRILASAYDQGFRLHPIQAQAVRDFEILRGLFAPIGVGWGKTLVSLMIAESAYQRFAARIILAVPASVYTQLTVRDIPWARSKVPLSAPFIYLGGLSQTNRQMRATSGKRGVYVLPYSLLSTANAEDILRAIWPELIILDEAHQVKNPHTGRTQRLMRLIKDKRPAVAVLSGTITQRSLMDYHHLLVAALGESAPIPIPVAMANDWAGVLDADGSDGNVQVVQPVLDWAVRTFPAKVFAWDRSGYRAAYRLRLSSAPGVVGSSDAELGVSITIANGSVLPVGESGLVHYSDMDLMTPDIVELSRLMRLVEEQWKTPDGDEIEIAIHTYKWLIELSAGFYYSLQWPTIPQIMEKLCCAESYAEGLLKASKEHHAAQQFYHARLRDWIKQNGRHRLDTPMLVGLAMHNHGAQFVGEELYTAWTAMKAIAYDNLITRISTPVLVSDFKLRSAVEWAQQRSGGGIIWYYHNAIGVWLQEMLLKVGVDSTHCPAGENEKITDPANKDRIIVASMTAHGVGKNLQHFQDVLILQWPRQAALIEQVLGRNHRFGQQADELTYDTRLTLTYDYMVFNACLRDALYVQQTTGQRNKVVIAGYNPLPVVFPAAVLRERGLEPCEDQLVTQRMDEMFSGAKQ